MKRLFITAAFMLGAPIAHAAAVTVTIYKSPDCACCEGWVKHVRTAGFATNVVDTSNLQAVKDQLSVPTFVRSCHTAVVSATNQVIEGHVPASAIKKLVAQRAVRGVAAPGMPMNSPGMGKMDGKLVTVDFSGEKFSQD
ncbi:MULTISPECIES: DUF411 domain-containing protein [Caballeronia]|uniref:DUF411 domain-containing protein n=1 Tax=Caballeronia TaxID=1827195 RepID=UPI0004A3383F|nr:MULTISPECIES: DUF411 domain-containing protein [Caballeronia]MCE4547784.1 CopG family transcriptional regulator [Caballeronia sp. PC1]MCE4575662.1 CopG family transcriptional regulator [Caballeronia sp. CLC5]